MFSSRDSTRKQGSLPFGAKKESAADIIAKSKKEREERAKKKKEEESAIKIQAACRSYVARKRQQREWQREYEAAHGTLPLVARLRLWLALSGAAQSSALSECAAELWRHWDRYLHALADTPSTRLHQARHVSKRVLDELKSRASTDHVPLAAAQLIALVDRCAQQEHVAQWLIERAELFRTIHELCARYGEHVTALLDLAAHSYARAPNTPAASAQLLWHTLSLPLTDAHVTLLARTAARALQVLTRDLPRAAEFVALFRAHKFDVTARELQSVVVNAARMVRALVEDTEHAARDQARDQFAQWIALVEQCATQARDETAQHVRASSADEDAMEIEFSEPAIVPRDQDADATAAHVCRAVLAESARDRSTVLAALARVVTAAHAPEWHSAALTRLVAHLLPHSDAHDTRRVLTELADAYLALWPRLRVSDEFRRLLRDVAGTSVEHSWQSATSASTDTLLHAWLVLTVAHAQLARIDRTAAAEIPQPVLTVTRELCSSFQDKLLRLYWREESVESAALLLLRGAVSRLLSLAHELAAVQPSVWPAHVSMSAAQALELLAAYPQSFKRVLRHVPFLLAAKEKVALLQHWIRADKEVHQPLEQGQVAHIQIRRTHLLQDVFNKLAPPGTSLKRTVKIEFVNQAGLLEAGIDGGGLFRELVNEVIKTAFSPQYGLFKATEHEQLYPNPASALLVENDRDKFRFLGRLLGKCIYELCLVDVVFTEFFLAQLLDRPVAVHQLQSLDAALYKGLTALREYAGPFEALELTFTATEDSWDASGAPARVVELVAEGSHVPVTRDNVEEYIALVARHRLQTQIAAQCRAFQLGVCDVIDREWLALLGWSEREFALLINGEQLVHGIDIAAMQQHVVYAGGYHAHHPVILMFWEVLSEFTPEQQSMLLKYATSSPRPPLLGFGTLQPKFCIKLSSQDESYLPSANTCMNLLKLPAYHAKSTMRAKLLYAIQSNSGFDLS